MAQPKVQGYQLDIPSIGSSLTLNDISDVSAALPSDGDIIQWNAGTTSWQSSTLALSTLSDVTTSPTVSGELLVWNSGTSLWESKLVGYDLGEYALASLPAAATYPNCWALVTDAAGGRTIVRSDGTDWRIVAVEGAIVS